MDATVCHNASLRADMYVSQQLPYLLDWKSTSYQIGEMGGALTVSRSLLHASLRINTNNKKIS